MHLASFLLDSASRAPDAQAYVEGEAITSYGELARRAGRFAHELLRLGVRPGERVAMVLDACVEYPIAYYGVLLSGAVVVPLGTDTRPRSLRHALLDCGATAIVIAGHELRHLIPIVTELPDLKSVIHVGGSPPPLGDAIEVAAFESLTGAGSEMALVGDHGDALAALHFTSGTTGKPKGVMLSHRGLVANVCSIVQYLELTSDDRVAMVLPYYYVYGSSVLNTHIASGATIVHGGTMAFPVRVIETIAQQRCTGFSGVPSTFARLLSTNAIGSNDLSSLRYLTQAGAPMTRALTSRLRDAFPGAKVFVMYGQTEASARLSYLPPEDVERKLGSAGIAIPGVTIEIVDSAGATLPAGEVGEIVASGENLMLGYWKDEEASAHALRGGKLHTGDLGRLDEEGYLYIVGRESDMIKSGGHRIGPQEIEEVVASVPGVAECAAVGVADELLGQAIAIYVVVEEGAEVDERSIKKVCFQELPRHKMPAQIHFIDALPRSDRGKVLRSALRERT